MCLKVCHICACLKWLHMHREPFLFKYTIQVIGSPGLETETITFLKWIVFSISENKSTSKIKLVIAIILKVWKSAVLSAQYSLLMTTEWCENILPKERHSIWGQDHFLWFLWEVRNLTLMSTLLQVVKLPLITRLWKSFLFLWGKPDSEHRCSLTPSPSIPADQFLNVEEKLLLVNVCWLSALFLFIICSCILDIFFRFSFSKNAV